MTQYLGRIKMEESCQALVTQCSTVWDSRNAPKKKTGSSTNEPKQGSATCLAEVEWYMRTGSGQ